MPGVFPDEASNYADSMLASLEGKTILVPAIWSLEIANAILIGERRKRLNQPDIRAIACPHTMRLIWNSPSATTRH